jgi:hypothetical protein
MADVEGEIILCFECGTKNRLKSEWTGAPVCGKCGEPLPIQARPVSRPSGSVRASGSKVSLRFLVLLCVGFVAVMGYLGVKEVQTPDKGAAPNPATSAEAFLDEVQPPGKGAAPNPYLTSVPSPDPSVPPATNRLSIEGLVPLNVGHERDIQVTSVPRPQETILAPVKVRPGVILKRTTADSVAPFQIKTSPGANYVVKLVDAMTGASVVGIYVVGGHTLEVNVPLGRYKMRYASGQIWYGFKHRFGPKTEYAKADDIFDFAIQGNQISGYTVELIRQMDGNLATRQIDAKDF